MFFLHESFLHFWLVTCFVSKDASFVVDGVSRLGLARLRVGLQWMRYRVYGERGIAALLTLMQIWRAGHRRKERLSILAILILKGNGEESLACSIK